MAEKPYAFPEKKYFAAVFNGLPLRCYVGGLP
jgi:hypothetical protein